MFRRQPIRGKELVSVKPERFHLLSVLNLIKTRAQLQSPGQEQPEARWTWVQISTGEREQWEKRGQRLRIIRTPALGVRRGGGPFLKEKRHVVSCSAWCKEPPSPSTRGHQATRQNPG